MRRLFLLIALLGLLGTVPVHASEGKPATHKSSSNNLSPIDRMMESSPLTGGAFEEKYPDISAQAIVLVLLALMPFLIMLLTSYLKIIISLVLLRNALGVQQTPPSQVLNGIALILSIYVMFPTGVAMYNQAKPTLNSSHYSSPFMSKESAMTTLKVVNHAKEPLRDFLLRNTPPSQIKSFVKIAQKSFPAELVPNITDKDFLIVIPSFILGQIKSAFEIGVLIYLPFLVIDLVTANILVAMQMMMLSPLSISLPLKLLLIVMIDGWTLLLQGLMISFR
ncbi:Pathogenicity-related ORF2 [Candidatus Clavichlamydia salmonicola]|nr:type III secretion system export apparatus subunit SctR [Candidatus Clavichlamydia salmonicola]MBF5050564.1 Pathogenicity-related ORF2 [Candidatus Clavichlamydia salmonicola]